MSQLDRLEELAQRLVEGTFNRFFQADTQPAAHADTREVLRLGLDNPAAKHWVLHIGDRQIELGEPVIDIGRALDNDIVLSEPTVSRYHAQLRWREGRYVLCPPRPAADSPSAQTQRLASAPFTRLNGQPIAEDAPGLASGDRLEFGKTRLTVEVL